MPTADATRAVIEAARVIADRERAMIMAQYGRRWRNFISPQDAALIDALAQYDREAKDE